MTAEEIIAEIDRISVVCAQSLPAAAMQLSEGLKARLHKTGVHVVPAWPSYDRAGQQV